MATGKPWYHCWWVDENDECNLLTNQLDDTRNKLDDARKEIRRLKFENVSLRNKANIGLSNQSSLNNVTDLPHVSHPVPTFNYSSATMVIHPEYTSKQTSALDKLNVSKLQKKNANELQYEPLSDNEEYGDNQPSEYDKHREKVSELMIQIDRLSKIIQQKDKDYGIVIKEKDEHIDSLEKQIHDLKQEAKVSPAGNKSVSFAMSLNQEINDMTTDDDNQSQKSFKSQSSQNVSQSSLSKSSNSRTTGAKRPRNRYDNVKEQINILNTSSLKHKSLMLCREQKVINKSGKDKGLLLFFQKYLKTKTLEQIFTKSGKATKSDTDRISNATGLVNVLSFGVILYKVKVFQTETGNQKPEINNSEIKNSVKYLALWIVRTYGEKTRNKYYHNQTKKEYAVYNFKMSKDEFEKNMPRYIQQFVKNEGKHMDSEL
eukprot:111335_1